MASYAEDKWSHTTTIDLLLWQSVCIELMTNSFMLHDVREGFTIMCGKRTDSFTITYGKGSDSVTITREKGSDSFTMTCRKGTDRFTMICRKGPIVSL